MRVQWPDSRHHRHGLARMVSVVLLLITACAPSLAASPAVSADSGRERVGYYGNWTAYSSGYSLKDVDTSGAASNLTTLIYSFENINPDTLTCFQAASAASTDDNNPNAGDYAGDVWGDYQRPFSADEAVDGQADSPAQPLRGNFNQLKELKAKHPRLKMLLSIGGWTFSKYFSDAAATATSRQTFVSSCVDMYIRGNLPTGIAGDTTAGGPGAAAGIFDGIDIDWEFPASSNGHVGNHTSPNDTANYTALLAEFRSQLNAQGTIDGRHYYLTAAVPAGSSDIDNIQASQITPSLDWANVMTYDMHGAWETTGPTNFQAPLYTSPVDPATSQGLSVDQAIQHWEDAGIPANKLVMGIPFYWRGWSGVTAGTTQGLYQAAGGPSPAYPYTQQPGTAQYRELLMAGELNPLFLHTDPITQSPWIYDSSGTFYTGDTPASVGQKALYIRIHGLRGAMVFSLEGDDSQGSLLKALVSGLNGADQTTPYGYDLNYQPLSPAGLYGHTAVNPYDGRGVSPGSSSLPAPGPGPQVAPVL